MLTAHSGLVHPWYDRLPALIEPSDEATGSHYDTDAGSGANADDAEYDIAKPRPPPYVIGVDLRCMLDETICIHAC
jgi:hypothetical protein